MRRRDSVTSPTALQYKPKDAFELNDIGPHVEETLDNHNRSRCANCVPANATALHMVDGVATSSADTTPDPYVRNPTVKTSRNTLRGDWHGDGGNVFRQVGASRSAVSADRLYGLALHGAGDHADAIDHRSIGVDDPMPPSALETMPVLGANRDPTLDKACHRRPDFDHDGAAWRRSPDCASEAKVTRHGPHRTCAAPASRPIRPPHRPRPMAAHLEGLSVGDAMRRWLRQSPRALADSGGDLPAAIPSRPATPAPWTWSSTTGALSACATSTPAMGSPATGTICPCSNRGPTLPATARTSAR